MLVKFKPLENYYLTYFIYFLEINDASVSFFVIDNDAWEDWIDEPFIKSYFDYYIKGEEKKEEDEIYLSGYVKFDGCSHIQMIGEDGTGYYHFCGKEYWDSHTALMNYLFGKCFELMGREYE